MDFRRLYEDAAFRDKQIETLFAQVEKTNGEVIKSEIKKAAKQCLINAIHENQHTVYGGRGGAIHEATTTDNINFLGIQLPVITAMLSSLVLDDIAVVQALDRRVGSVFYMDVVRGTTKGGDDTSGTTLISATSGHAAGVAARKYASNNVYNETLGTKGSGNVFTATVTSSPVVTGSTIVVVSTSGGVQDTLTVASTSGGTDVLAGATLSGTVDLETGVVTINGDGSSVTASASYKYNFEKSATGVPYLDLDMRSLPLTAEDFMLRARFSIPAAADLQKAHGISMDELLVKYLGGEMKFAIDHHGVDLLLDAAGGAQAATSPGTFNCALVDGQEWFFKRFQFMDYVAKASNNIFAKTKRAKANFLICGLDAGRVVAQMGGDSFKETVVDKPFGPHKIGTLRGMPVIVDPFIADTTIAFGYRGSDFFDGGFIYAPYIPMYATQMIGLSDLYNQQGFYSAAGYLVTNPGMFNKGAVVGLSY